MESMVKDFKIDKVLIAITTILVLFGLIMLYSTTMILAKGKYSDSYFFLKKQLIWLGLGLLIMIIISLFKYPLYLNNKIVYICMALATISLISVFFFGKINNSYRWIKIFGFSIQPSEFAKIVVVLYLSYIFSRKNIDINNLKKLAILLSPVFLIALLILKEPDYGTFILIMTVLMIMLFIAGFHKKYLLVGTICFAVFIAFMIKFNPERINRVMAFLNPEDYSATYSFQSMQSIYAIGAGGIFGQGLGNSTQKLYFLPYAYSDFIFAIIGEEVGLFGTLFMIALFYFFLIRGLNIAKASGNIQTYLLVIGLAYMVFIQAMINISVSIGIFPTKGIPLPFISNGGSSLIASLIITGIILNISRHRKMVLIND
jgi:cell division protein FtsW